MATLRQLRTRVASISNIQRVTNAMQMVAAAKMRRAQDAIQAARPYSQQLDAVLGNLQKSVDPGENPLFSKRPAERFRPADVVAVQHEAGEPQEFWTVAKGARVKHRPVAHDEAALEDGEETPGASSDDEGDDEDDAWAEEAAEPAGGPHDVRDEESSVVGQRFQ